MKERRVRGSGHRLVAVMMRLLGNFFSSAERLLGAGVMPEALADAPIFRSLMRMGEEIPDGAWERFSELERALTETERRLLAQGAGGLPEEGRK